MPQCEICQKSFIFNNMMRRFCTERCRKKAEKARAHLRNAPEREAKARIKEAAFIAQVKAVLARPIRPTLADRLEALSIPEPNSGCRLWLGKLTSTGYGQIKVGGKKSRVHRIAYELAKGPIPAGRIICHHCDVPNCIEPDHLYAGTHQTNSDDKWRRGRWRDSEGWKGRLRVNGRWRRRGSSIST